MLARLRAAVEALEDALDLRRGDPCSGVDHFHHHLPLAVEAAANGNAAGGWRVLTGVGEQADQHLAQQRRVALGGEIGLDFGAERSRRRLDRLDRVADRGRDVDDLGLAGAERLDPGEGEQRPGQAVHPLGVFGEAVEEVVAGLGIVLGAVLQDLDRAGDPGQRVAQLVRGVGDEVGFGELAPHLVGAVADDGEHRALVGQRAGLHRVGAVADPQRRVGGEADLLGAAQLRQHRLRGQAGRIEQVGGGAVGEADRAVEVDDHDRVGEAVEDRLELVAVGGEDAEALLQRGAHRLQGAGEVADLVEAAARPAARRRSRPPSAWRRRRAARPAWRSPPRSGSRR